MDLFEKLIRQLTLHEGLRLKPYHCTAGKLSIGIGRNLDDVGISKDEAEYLLKNDINKILRSAQTLPFWDKLSDNRKLVVLDMAFNLGWDGLMAFKNTLKAMGEGRYHDAANGMLASKWASQVNGRAVTLAQMMEKG